MGPYVVLGITHVLQLNKLPSKVSGALVLTIPRYIHTFTYLMCEYFCSSPNSKGSEVKGGHMDS